MRCECQKPGSVYSGVAGVLAGVSDELGRRYIERCDACERFHSDEAAALKYAGIKGGVCLYDKHHRVLWIPA